MGYKIIIIVVLLLYLNKYNSHEGVNFDDGVITKYYNKHGIVINRSSKTLYKGDKSVRYSSGFNPMVGTMLAGNKHRTKQLLNKYNLPTSKHYAWSTKLSYVDNIRHIQQLKFPIVIKPIVIKPILSNIENWRQKYSTVLYIKYSIIKSGYIRLL